MPLGKGEEIDHPALSGWALNSGTDVLIRVRQREITQRQKKRRQCDHGGRDWSYAAMQPPE